MEITVKELEETLLQLREDGAKDDTPLTFDIDAEEVDFEKNIYPSFYYDGACFAPYICVTLTN